MDHGQLNQEKSLLDHGPFVWFGLVQTRIFLVQLTMIEKTKDNIISFDI
jgi:hypothetical protein